MPRTEKTILRAIVDMDGTRFLAGMSRIRRKGVAVLKGMGSMGAAGAAAWGVAVKTTAAYGDEIAKTAKRMGIGTAELQRYRYAAKLSGADLAEMEKAVKRMSAVVYDAGHGLTTYTRVLDDLGVSIEDVKGKTPEQQLEVFLDALAKVQDESKRAALAQRLFGRSGTSMLPMLTKGSEGLKRMKREADRLGIIMPADQVRQAEDFNDALLRINERVRDIKRDATAGALAPLADVFDDLATNEEVMAGWSEIAGEVSGKMADLVGQVVAFGSNGENIDTMRTLFGNLGDAIGLTVEGIGVLITKYAALQEHTKETVDDMLEWAAKKGIIDLVGRGEANRLAAIDQASSDEQLAAAFRLKARGIDVDSVDRQTYQPMLLDEINRGREGGITAAVSDQKRAMASMMASGSTLSAMGPEDFHAALTRELESMGGMPAGTPGSGPQSMSAMAAEMKRTREVLEQRLPEAV